MTNSHQSKPVQTAFVGSIPQAYDTCLGPLLFEVPAADLASRVAAAVPSKSHVLEIACGTGICTRHLRKHLPEAQILASDLNQAMIDFAINQYGVLPGVDYQQADALVLPFDDNRFDAVVCQFGIMFFADKLKGLSEMWRVLKPGGFLAFNVWDSMESNQYVSFALQTIAEFFENDPPRFLEIPYGYSNTRVIESLMSEASFERIDMEIVSERIRLPDAMIPARGLIEGNPTILEIRERAGVDASEIVKALARTLEVAYGPVPITIPIQEIVFTARKPAGG